MVLFTVASEEAAVLNNGGNFLPEFVGHNLVFCIYYCKDCAKLLLKIFKNVK